MQSCAGKLFLVVGISIVPIEKLQYISRLKIISTKNNLIHVRNYTFCTVVSSETYQNDKWDK